MLINRNIVSFWLIALPNLGLFYFSLFLTISWRYGEYSAEIQWQNHLTHFTALHVIWLLVFWSMHMFERETFRRYTTLFFNLLTAKAINLLIAIGYFYGQPELILTPRRFLLVDVVICFLLILIWDLILKSLFFNWYVQSVYFLSLNNELKYLEREITKHGYLGFKVNGSVSLDELRGLPAGSLAIFPDDLHANAELANAIFDLRKKGIRFYNHNTFYESVLRRVYLPSVGEAWFLQNVSYARKHFYELLKVICDLVAGIVLFVFFLVTLPFVIFFMKIFSPGPILFTQDRVGKGGEVFKIFKYRTMTVGSAANTWTEPNDKRVTRFGKILRLSRLDELPQSINLLTGTMSIVGPRPEQVGIVENLKQQIPFYDERHIVKPGVTGWAQLNIYASNLNETKLKLEYDLYYVKNQSIFFDMEIVFKTVYKILTLQGK